MVQLRYVIPLGAEFPPRCSLHRTSLDKVPLVVEEELDIAPFPAATHALELDMYQSMSTSRREWVGRVLRTPPTVERFGRKNAGKEHEYHRHGRGSNSASLVAG